MRWLILATLLLSLKSQAQRADSEIQTMVRQMAESADVLEFLDPEFKWDMDGRTQVELNEGINYLKEGKPNIAVEKFNSAIKLDKQVWVAHYYKGVCLKLLGQYGNAAYSLVTADIMKPSDFAINIELGKTHALLKNNRDAERHFNRAAAIRPTSGLPSYLLGNHLLETKSIVKARAQYEKAIKIDPMMLNAEVKLGVLAAAEGKTLDECLAYFSNVLTKDSLHKPALIYHGMATFESDRKSSLKDWTKLVRLTPSNSFFRMMLGSLKTKEGRYTEAFSEFRKVVDLAQLNENTFVGQQTSYDKAIDITNAGYYVMTKVYGFSDEDGAEIRKAYCLLFVGMHDEALRAILNVKDFESPVCLFLKAIANEHMGDHSNAFYNYNSAIVRDNDIIDAHKKRGIYYTEMKLWQAAEKDFNEMLRINPETFYAYRLRGVVRYHDKNYVGAITDFTKYLEKDSANKEVLGYRGMANKQSKRVLESTLDFLKSDNHQAVEPFPVIKKELDFWVSEGDTAVALNWLGRFTAAMPMYFDAQIYLLKLLMSLNRWDAVGLQVDRALLDTPETKGKQVGAGYTNESLSYLLAVKGTALVNTGQHDEGMKQLDVAIQKDKENSLAYLLRGKANLKQNNKSAAVRDFKKAAKMGEQEASDLLKGLE